MRSKRRQFTSQQQQQAALDMLHQWREKYLPQCDGHLGIYWPSDGEIDPLPLAEYARSAGIRVYLPVLHPWRARQLWFLPFTDRTVLAPNRFGIPEPQDQHCRPIKAQQLGQVLMPLVAFDRQGGRLGMGGGFYDTTFAFKHHHPQRPQLIGLAHSAQEVASLTLAPWDVPLDGVITEREWIVCQGSRSAKPF